nr:hypothetical protein [Acidobacteriota bacterium]
MTTYSYSGAALNDESHAASVFYAHYPRSTHADSREFLARRENTVFLGHTEVTTTRYDGASTSAASLGVV